MDDRMVRLLGLGTAIAIDLTLTLHLKYYIGLIRLSYTLDMVYFIISLSLT